METINHQNNREVQRANQIRDLNEIKKLALKLKEGMQRLKESRSSSDKSKWKGSYEEVTMDMVSLNNLKKELEAKIQEFNKKYKNSPTLSLANLGSYRISEIDDTRPRPRPEPTPIPPRPRPEPTPIPPRPRPEPTPIPPRPGRNETQGGRDNNENERNLRETIREALRNNPTLRNATEFVRNNFYDLLLLAVTAAAIAYGVSRINALNMAKEEMDRIRRTPDYIANTTRFNPDRPTGQPDNPTPDDINRAAIDKAIPDSEDQDEPPFGEYRKVQEGIDAQARVQEIEEMAKRADADYVEGKLNADIGSTYISYEGDKAFAVINKDRGDTRTIQQMFAEAGLKLRVGGINERGEYVDLTSSIVFTKEGAVIPKSVIVNGGIKTLFYGADGVTAGTARNVLNEVNN